VPLLEKWDFTEKGCGSVVFSSPLNVDNVVNLKMGGCHVILVVTGRCEKVAISSLSLLLQINKYSCKIQTIQATNNSKICLATGSEKTYSYARMLLSCQQ